MKKISEAGGMTILDPAPIPKNDVDDVFTVVDILTPNQHEAERLLNQRILNSEDAIQGAIALVKRGVSRPLSSRWVNRASRIVRMASRESGCQHLALMR
jgi:pyridoxal/pyridoxine/pyridoxamine kinase